MDRRCLTVANGGEVSPDLYGRFDVPKVANGYKTIMNFIVTIQGTAYFRGGFKYLAKTKDRAKKSYLDDFTYTEQDAYILEWGDKYVRFYRNGEPVMKNGAVYELETPYGIADLADENGVFLLRKAQSGNVMYLFNAKYPPHVLERTDAANHTFTLKAVDYAEFGGFEDLNKDEKKTVSCSAQEGVVTLTASASIFKQGHIGALFFIRRTNTDGIYSWSEGAKVTAGQRIISADNTYVCASSGSDLITGASKPTHTEGKSTDGKVDWQYEDSGYGICKITAVATDGKSATANVLVKMPVHVVKDKSSWKWKFGSWCAEYGYPSDGCFHRERLTLMRKRRGWFSWQKDFEDFSEYDKAAITYECGFAFDVAAGTTLGNVQWIVSAGNLVVGTTSNVCAVGEADTSQSFSIYNSRSEEHEVVAVRNVPPVKIGQQVVFVSASGKDVRCLTYNYDTNKYKSITLCEYAQHINQSGVVKLVRQKEPFDLIYCLREDGQISLLLFNPEQDGLSWAQFKTDGFVESIAAEGNTVYAIVRRRAVIDGAFVENRCIEVLQNPFQRYFSKTLADFETAREYNDYRRQVFLDDQKRMIYADSAVIKSSDAAFNRVGGLEHLAGRDVCVVTDGGKEIAKMVQKDVSGDWGVDLELPCTTAIVGLPYKGILIPTGISESNERGNVIVNIKRITRISFMVHNSVGGLASDGNGTQAQIVERGGGDNIDNPVPLFSGTIEEQAFDGTYDRDADLVITQPYPFPFCLQAIIYDYSTGE